MTENRNICKFSAGVWHEEKYGPPLSGLTKTTMPQGASMDPEVSAPNTRKYLMEFPFTDLYVRIDADGAPSRYRPDITRIPAEKYVHGNFEVPMEYDGNMAEIRAAVLEKQTDEGTITYQGMRMRFVSMTTEGETWAALRAVPLDIPDFDSLGLEPEFVKKIKSLANKKGLIIVGGKTGEGKTTTCVSFLKYFLDRHGGLLFTCEDPPEYSIHGALSEKAFCIQYEIRNNEDWVTGAKAAMRSRPDYILFGEIRTPEAAELLLKAATSGHLVVATIHAGNVADSISALMQLAENKVGKVAREIVGDRLLAAFHQSLTANGPNVQAIIPGTSDDNEKKTIREIIKNGELSGLGHSTQLYRAVGKRRPKQR
jgi:twitching motility protein PilT